MLPGRAARSPAFAAGARKAQCSAGIRWSRRMSRGCEAVRRKSGHIARISAYQKVVILNRFLFANGRMLHLIEAMCSLKSGSHRR